MNDKRNTTTTTEEWVGQVLAKLESLPGFEVKNRRDAKPGVRLWVMGINSEDENWIRNPLVTDRWDPEQWLKTRDPIRDGETRRVTTRPHVIFRPTFIWVKDAWAWTIHDIVVGKNSQLANGQSIQAEALLDPLMVPDFDTLQISQNFTMAVSRDERAEGIEHFRAVVIGHAVD